MGNQKPRTVEEQIERLRIKGMHFLDMEAAKEYLSHISYFRLKYYWKDMVDPANEDSFLDSACFDDVISRYNFDRELRLVLFDAIEVIEVALRTKIISHMSQAFNNGTWYLDSSLFEDRQYHEKFVLDLKREFNRSTEPFAKEYISNHPDWNYESLGGATPDAWMIFESATFGTLSKMFKNLRNQLPQSSRIANDFGHNSVRDFSNWLECISVTRNIIAHHSRLWNRAMAKKITSPRRMRGVWLSSPLTEYQKRKPYGVIAAMLYLCNMVYPDNSVRKKILALVSNYPDVPIASIGFTDVWQGEALWR